MAQELAFPTGEVTKKVTVVASAFGTGVIMGAIARNKPEIATMSSLLIGAVGVLGSIMGRGMLADLSLGVGSAAIGALGSSIPAMFAKPSRQIQGQGASGTRLLTAPTNVVGETIASRARSGVEF